MSFDELKASASRCPYCNRVPTMDVSPSGDLFVCGCQSCDIWGDHSSNENEARLRWNEYAHGVSVRETDKFLKEEGLW